jgi:phosphohistidine phosphatase
MQVYFVRHATAASKSSWTQDDELRPLTRAGRRRFAAAAAALVAAGCVRLDLIVTSPLVRARETAELFRDTLGGQVEIVDDPRLGTGFDMGDFSAIIAEHAEMNALAIVGHNPSFGGVLSAVTGGSAIDVRKGAIALVDIADAADPVGRLLWLAPPSLFGSAADEQA